MKTSAASVVAAFLLVQSSCASLALPTSRRSLRASAKRPEAAAVQAPEKQTSKQPLLARESEKLTPHSAVKAAVHALAEALPADASAKGPVPEAKTPKADQVARNKPEMVKPETLVKPAVHALNAKQAEKVKFLKAAKAEEAEEANAAAKAKVKESKWLKAAKAEWATESPKVRVSVDGKEHNLEGAEAQKTISKKPSIMRNSEKEETRKKDKQNIAITLPLDTKAKVAKVQPLKGTKVAPMQTVAPSSEHFAPANKSKGVIGAHSIGKAETRKKDKQHIAITLPLDTKAKVAKVQPLKGTKVAPMQTFAPSLEHTAPANKSKSVIGAHSIGAHKETFQVANVTTNLEPCTGNMERCSNGCCGKSATKSTTTTTTTGIVCTSSQIRCDYPYPGKSCCERTTTSTTSTTTRAPCTYPKFACSTGDGCCSPLTTTAPLQQMTIVKSGSSCPSGKTPCSDPKYGGCCPTPPGTTTTLGSTMKSCNLGEEPCDSGCCSTTIVTTTVSPHPPVVTTSQQVLLRAASARRATPPPPTVSHEMGDDTVQEKDLAKEEVAYEEKEKRQWAETDAEVRAAQLESRLDKLTSTISGLKGWRSKMLTDHAPVPVTNPKTFLQSQARSPSWWGEPRRDAELTKQVQDQKEFDIYIHDGFKDMEDDDQQDAAEVEADSNLKA